MNDMIIRQVTADDWPALWAILQPVLREGATYPTPVDISEAQAKRYWLDVPAATYLAVDRDGNALGTYYLKPNQIGLGSHVCNAGYIVSQHARGKGVASTMCQHSQDEARSLGYRAMQYNLVVSTNTKAVALWQRMGFERVATLEGAFNHAELGEVDAYVMYKRLVAVNQKR